MNEKYYKISESELKQLLRDSFELETYKCLIATSTEIEEMIEEIIKSLCEIKE